MCWRTTVSMSILELMLEFGTCWYQFISEKSILAAAAARWPNVHSFHIYLFPVSVPMFPVLYFFLPQSLA